MRINWDNIEGWSKERAQTLAKANSKLTQRTVNSYLASFVDDSPFSAARRWGLWMYNPNISCYTFMPFRYGWASPYGASYLSFYSSGPYCCGRYDSPYFGIGGNGSSGGRSGGSVGPPVNPPTAPGRSIGDSPTVLHGKPDMSPGGGPIRPIKE
jgi:hypothetical protein